MILFTVRKSTVFITNQESNSEGDAKVYSFIGVSWSLFCSEAPLVKRAINTPFEIICCLDLQTWAKQSISLQMQL